MAGMTLQDTQEGAMTSLLVLGGARSGKSRYAQQRCEALGERLVYVATAEARDEEMAQRIARHRDERGLCWETIEAPIDLCSAIMAAASGRADAIMVDCLTLWLSNLLLAGEDIAQACHALVQTLRGCTVPVTLIANEVGLGIVPDNELARRFRDEAGWLNQLLAKSVTEVVFVAAGLPVMLKG